MIFILLTFFAAFFLEGIGSIISIIGLMSLFGINYFIICMAIAFDMSKLITVSILYREWYDLNKTLKFYLTLAAIVLILITSYGAAGYLSSEFQKAILPTLSIDIKVKAIEEEKLKLEKRKLEIDKQITNLPADMVKGRTKLIANFKTELEQTNARIVTLDQELPKLKIEAVDKTSHAGPITFIAKIFNITPESAMSYLIGLIVLVFDPLAVALILAGNYLVLKRNKKNIIEEPIVKTEPIVSIQNTDIEEHLDQFIAHTRSTIQNENLEDVIEPKVNLPIILEEPRIIELQNSYVQAEEPNKYIFNDLINLETNEDISLNEEEVIPTIDEFLDEGFEIIEEDKVEEYVRKYDDETLGYSPAPLIFNKPKVSLAKPEPKKSTLHDLNDNNVDVTYDF